MRTWVNALIAMFLIAAAGAVPSAAQRRGGPSSPQLPTEFTLRFDVNLVQVDAVVTDSHGHYATNLQAGDFEVFQDGRRRDIKYFTFVGAAAGGNEAAPATPALNRALTRAEVKRTFFIFIDDIEMPFADFSYMRRALLDFVQREIRPGDLFALMKSSGGSGVWQVFSSDPHEIRAAVDHLSWLPPPPIIVSQHFRVFFSRLQLAIGALRSIPGRKVLVLMNNEFPAVPFQDLTHVSEAANHASVVIYALDTRGLPVSEAMDHFADASQPRLEDQRFEPHVFVPTRSERYYASQSVGQALALDTGGLFLHDSNNMDGEMRAVSQDTMGYYLIGWDPGPQAFDGHGYPHLPYHRIVLKVRQKGLTVRSRSGFYGMPQSDRHGGGSVKAQVADALFSPFRSGEFAVESRSSFENDSSTGPYVESLVHIAPGGIAFEEQPGGCSVVRLEVLASALPLETSDQPLADSQMTSLKLCGEAETKARRDGLVYVLRTRAGRPGPYEMRVAVRNTAPGDHPSMGPGSQTLTRRIDGVPVHIKVGSSIQFIEVPTLRKDEPALSGVALALDGESAPAGTAVPAGGDVILAEFRPAVPHDPAVRVFQPGDRLAYSCHLLQPAPAAGQPWRASMKVLHDGRELSVQQLAVDGDRIHGALQLDRAAVPGRYLLQIELTPGAKTKPVSQWIDFEVEPGA